MRTDIKNTTCPATKQAIQLTRVTFFESELGCSDGFISRNYGCSHEYECDKRHTTACAVNNLYARDNE